MEVRQTLGGRYQLLDELGSGGMAVVWRARDEVLGRPVAVKLLAGRFSGDPQSRARIRDEARAAATLSHPNVAQVYDYGEVAGTGTPYVVMELVNGPTLQQRVSAGRLPPRTVFRICGEVAAGLAAAHAHGLVHRDIKMANVMVTPAGAKVVDFGIAAEAGPASPEEMLVGTPAYLAPERLTGDLIVPASDVYALGVLLYRLLTDESPWSVESTTQMLRAHVHLDPAPLPSLPGVPPAVGDLIGRCLRKDPADRPSAGEVSGILGDAAEAAQTDPVRVESGPPATRIPPPADGRPDDLDAETAVRSRAARRGPNTGPAGDLEPSEADHAAEASHAGRAGGARSGGILSAGPAGIPDVGPGRMFGAGSGGILGAGPAGILGMEPGGILGMEPGGIVGADVPEAARPAPGGEDTEQRGAGRGDAGRGDGGRGGTGRGGAGRASSGGVGLNGGRGSGSGLVPGLPRNAGQEGAAPVGGARAPGNRRAASASGSLTSGRWASPVRPGGAVAVGGGVRRVPNGGWWDVLAERKRLVLGGIVVVVVISALVGLALGGPSGVDSAAPEGVDHAPAAPTVSSRPGVPAPSDGRAVTPPAATGAPVRPPIARSEPTASAGPGGAGASEHPGAGAPTEPSPSIVRSAAPEGKRLDSKGGFVYAVCGAGKATLTSWGANPGFTVEKVTPGPALTAEIVFRGTPTRYRMTVTCVAGTPTPLELPL